MGPVGPILVRVYPIHTYLSITLEGLATVSQMAGVELRRDRLFQRIAQRHSPPKAV